ncbi:MAG: hypothetical protein AB7W47_10425 [Calditrichaceae bacterium]
MRIIFFSIFLITPLLFAQQIDKKQVINSGNYYYGSGVAHDTRESRDRALEELTEQIAVRVAKSFESKIIENAAGLDESVKSIIRTHSAATLQNVNTIKKPLANGEIETFCYLDKKEVFQIFEERKKLISEIARKAELNALNHNTAFALKLNYYALLLVQSLPDESVVYQDINYTTELPARINRILLDLKFTFAGDKKISDMEREITLHITSNGIAVSLIDFTFWDGTSQVAVEGRDGIATFRLLGASTNFESLKLFIKYAYYESRQEYNVVGELWNVVNLPTFNSAKNVDLNQKVKSGQVQTSGASNKWNMNLTLEKDILVEPTILKSASEFLDLLSKNDKSMINEKYSNDPFLNHKIINYLRYNSAEPATHNIEGGIFKTSSGYELRKIRMLHHYPGINKQSTEYLVLDFSDKGILIDFNLSISENLYRHFSEQAKYGNDWENRQDIIKFVEKYRTAYQTRDIETVDLMFADEALILVGRKITPVKLPDNMVNYQKFTNQPDYEYVRLTKKHYLKRQEQVFNLQKDIFLDFGSFDIIKKNSTEGVYGVEMRQSYYSTTYSDEGYLFLLIDFTEKDPLIYVRAWQPNEWDEDSLIKTANFKIYK